MEFRTHARGDGIGLRLRWPSAVRNAQVTRIAIRDQSDSNPTEHYIDCELVDATQYQLTLTLRPTRETDPIRTIADINRADLASAARFRGYVRDLALPHLLLTLDEYLDGLTPGYAPPRPGEWRQQEPQHRWSYLGSDHHFDDHLRVTRSVDKLALRPGSTLLDVANHLVGHESPLWYSDAVVTATYNSRD